MYVLGRVKRRRACHLLIYLSKMLFEQIYNRTAVSKNSNWFLLKINNWKINLHITFIKYFKNFNFGISLIASLEPCIVYLNEWQLLPGYGNTSLRVHLRWVRLLRLLLLLFSAYNSRSSIFNFIRITKHFYERVNFEYPELVLNMRFGCFYQKYYNKLP